MVALALLAIAALTLVALSFTSLASRQKAEDRAAASMLAAQELERAVYEIQNLPSGDSFWDGSREWSKGSSEVGGTTFSYRVDSLMVDTGTSAPNRLKKLNVSVWWWSTKPDSSRAGYGKLEVSASRIVSENKQ